MMFIIKGKDIRALVENYYTGIGLETSSILNNSDLYEKEGKNQHAFCTSIDKAGDVRILTNLRDNYNWTGTLLHELGHAVYDVNINHNLPFFLRDPAHIFTTEAIANFFGLMASDPGWMKKNLNISDEEANVIAGDAKNVTIEKSIFSPLVPGHVQV
ncbi:MAG: hypothetical protein HC906_01755 [Bacteroidales bacterium]|nr:hypothetical protein [Bacteroidales bacterium]